MLNFEDLSKKELIDLIVAYNDYVIEYFEEHKEGTPVCVSEFFDNEYQEMKNVKKETEQNGINAIKRFLNDFEEHLGSEFNRTLDNGYFSYCLGQKEMCRILKDIIVNFSSIREILQMFDKMYDRWNNAELWDRNKGRDYYVGGLNLINYAKNEYEKLK